MGKASRAVQLGALTTLSVIVMAGCSEDMTADCVDKNSRADDGSYLTVDDRFCDSDGSHSHYTYVYGGSSYRTAGGSRLRGGSWTKPADTNITTRSGRVIQRGGFGFRGGGGG